MLRSLVFALLLLKVALLARAWDAERMTAAAQRHGARAQAAVQALQPLLRQAQTQDDIARLAAINHFFNREVQFRDDLEVWGAIDYWASPLEMLARGQGDCEDYAIAKYLSLVAVGLPVHKLRLVYVRARLAGPPARTQAHMVLAYYAQPQAEPLILDNLVDEVLPAGQRRDLTPVFSFNSEGLWEGVDGRSAGDPQARLSRWRDVLARASLDGFL